MNRFERLALDYEPEADEAAVGRATMVYRDDSRTIISTNDSPDIPFAASLNPYRGCEHGCIYCYARPTHEYLGLSTGLDFESRLFAKLQAPDLLREALGRRSWTPTALALSGVTDPYQPVERGLRITRGCLEVLAVARHPVGVVTKSALVTRDVDVLGELARVGAVHVALSITTLDETLRRRLEPRAATAERRLDAIATLAAAGVPAGVMVAPVIPGLTDHEIPRILERAAAAGATSAGFVMLRLPHGVSDLFVDWLRTHYPEREAKVLGRVRDVRGGALTDPRFGSRMRGSGPYAEMIERSFRMARQRAGLDHRLAPLATDAFRRPGLQPSLFDRPSRGAG